MLLAALVRVMPEEIRAQAMRIASERLQNLNRIARETELCPSELAERYELRQLMARS